MGRERTGKWRAWWKLSRQSAGLRWQKRRWHWRALCGRRAGVSPRPPGPQLIVSLTTIPARLSLVHLAIEPLLRQSLSASRIVLWLSDELGPKDLPLALRRQQRRGLEVRFRRDLRSYTKLIHALKEFPEDVIVTADDDTFYPRDWLEQLWNSFQRRPDSVHCHRAHAMLETELGTLRPYLEWTFFSPGELGPSHRLMPTGVGGILYPPGILPAEVFDDGVYLRLCPTADDVWFKAMALLAGVPTMKVSPEFAEYPTIPGTQRKRLCAHNFADGNNDRQIAAVFGHYDLLPLVKLEPCFQPSEELFIGRP
ncbi:MAG: glycosyltransferase [Verrucomicrobiota bacterium]